MIARRDDAEPRAWWVAVAAVPLGFGAGPAFLYAAARARARSYAVYGVVWLVVCLVGLVLTLEYPEDSSGDQLGSFLMVMTWIVGLAQAVVMRRSWAIRVRAHDADPILVARERLRRRDELRRVAAEDPRLAREMGIGTGRGADDAGLVDVNHAPQAALATLPGVDRALARRIAAVRAEIHGFSSVEDLGTVLDLPADVVEAIRDRAIFLPRG